MYSRLFALIVEQKNTEQDHPKANTQFSSVS